MQFDPRIARRVLTIVVAGTLVFFICDGLAIALNRAAVTNGNIQTVLKQLRVEKTCVLIARFDLPLMAMGIALLAVAFAARRAIPRVLQRQCRCISCGYDLSPALRSGGRGVVLVQQCPECGTPFTLPSGNNSPGHQD